MGCEQSKKQSGRQKGLKMTNGKTSGYEQCEYKIVFLGECGVGKSSITQRYCNNTFSNTYEVTIGGAYLQKTTSLKSGQSVKLHLWDTSGEERFRAMAPLYYRDAKAMIVVYDVTDMNSFDAIGKYWLGQFEQKKKNDNVVIGIIGNKFDVDPIHKVISTEMGRNFAQQHKMIFAETSAKTGQGIDEFFSEITEQLFKNYAN